MHRAGKKLHGHTKTDCRHWDALLRRPSRKSSLTTRFDKSVLYCIRSRYLNAHINTYTYYIYMIAHKKTTEKLTHKTQKTRKIVAFD